MATDLYSDFDEQYFNVAAKLKKRFLRKPNIQEVLNEFLVLANQCIDSEQPAIAAQALVMAAKCENSLGNFLGEADCLVSAARQYMKEEQKLVALKCFSPARENLESSIGCYMQAVTKYPEESPLRTNLYLELANSLYNMRVFDEAISFYTQAVEALDMEPAVRVKYLTRLMEIYIHIRNHRAALDVCTQLLSVSKQYTTLAIERENQLYGIFLLLLVEPPSHKIHERLKHVLDRIEQGSEDQLQIEYFETLLCIKIESILMAYKSKDTTSLASMFSDCSSYLNLIQRDLFQRLIQKLDDTMT